MAEAGYASPCKICDSAGLVDPTALDYRKPSSLPDGARGIPEEHSVAIQELNDEQIRTWSLEQKDRWWLEQVFRGNMPQLTWRSALTGMGLGAILSLTNIYVGAKSGWTLGVGITSVILAFALFKALSRLGMASEFTILENNAMQSIATASGYMTSPLI